MTEFSLYLASQSPRRSELLAQVGVSFKVLSVNIDETVKPNESAKKYVLRLAKEKAIAASKLENLLKKPILGSDTSVVINEKILGKPKNNTEAKKMLKLLSGKTHQVMTAVALVRQFKTPQQLELTTRLSVSDVTFKVLSESEIQQYVDSGECKDKAGAYGIQGKAAAFISHLSGSYSGVMGLPLYETLELLNKTSI